MSVQFAAKDTGSARPAMVLSSPAVMAGLIRSLGAVLGKLREDRGLHASRIAAHLDDGRGTDPRKLERFERGTTQIHAMDEVVGYYSLELGVPVLKIAEMAVERLKADLKAEETPARIERALKGVARSTRPTRGASAPKRDAKPK